MSLINNMLRDVHQRHPSVKTAVHVSEKTHAGRSKKKMVLLVCASGMFLAGMLHFAFLKRNDFILGMMNNDPFYAAAFKVYDKVYDLFTPDTHFQKNIETSMNMDIASENFGPKPQFSEDNFQQPQSKIVYFTQQAMDAFFQQDNVQGLHTILSANVESDEPEDKTKNIDQTPVNPVVEKPNVEAMDPEPEPVVKNTPASARVAKNGILPPKTMVKNERLEQRISENALSQAAAFVQEGKLESARNILQESLQSQPLDHEVRAALADLYIEMKEFSIAEKLANAGLDLVPEQPGLVRVLARAQAAQGKYESAITLLLNAPPILRDQPEHYSLLAALYQKEGRYDLAAQIYMDLVHFFPQNGRWWTGLGISLEENKDTQAAFDSYMRSLSATDLDPSLRSFVLNRIAELSKNQGIVMSGAVAQTTLAGGAAYD